MMKRILWAAVAVVTMMTMQAKKPVMPPFLKAGDTIGTLTVKNDKGTAAEIAILAPEDVGTLTLWDLWWKIMTA